MCTPSGLVIDVQGIISTMAPILKSEPQKEEVYWIGNLSTSQKEAQKWESLYQLITQKRCLHLTPYTALCSTSPLPQ